MNRLLSAPKAALANKTASVATKVNTSLHVWLNNLRMLRRDLVLQLSSGLKKVHGLLRYNQLSDDP